MARTNTMDNAQTSLETPGPDWPDDWFEEAASCLFCSSNDCAPEVSGVQDWFFHAVPGEFTFARCPSCRSLLLTRRPGSDHIGKAYQNYFTHGQTSDNKASQSLVRNLGRLLSKGYAQKRYGASERIFDRLCSLAMVFFPIRKAVIDGLHRQLPTSSVSVLDYGCGNGDFLVLAKSLGNRVVGVDFDLKAAQVARDRGLEVLLPAEIDPSSFAQAFDFITLSHVIEHVADPVGLLRDLRQWLKPDGMVYIEVPNAEAAGLARHGRFWRGLEAPRHFALPSVQGLSSALLAARLRPVSMTSRLYAESFMNAVSRKAAMACGQTLECGDAIDQCNGPDILVCIARPI